MVLPKPPRLTDPVPNQPFSSPEETSIKGPYWDMPIGAGLEADGQGSIQITGSEPSEPSAYLYGPAGFVGLGTGLSIDIDGNFVRNQGYIYCTPQFSNLPVEYPPYSCETNVNTAGVIDFTEAWAGCNNLTEFPCVDTSSGTNFSYAWDGCYSLTSFPTLNTGNGTEFPAAWQYCAGLTSFPRVNVSQGTNFYYTWSYCYSLASFPPLDMSSGVDFTQTWGFLPVTTFPQVDTSSGSYFTWAWLYCENLTSFPTLDVSNGTEFIASWAGCNSLTEFPVLDFSSGTDFSYAWQNCSSLTTFPAGVFDNCQATDFSEAWNNCALDEESVDNILVSLDTAGQSDGVVHIDNGTSSAPGTAGTTAKNNLIGKGWTVVTN